MKDDMTVAAKLSVLFDAQIEPDDGGFKIKEVNGKGIYVLRMIYNWRIARSDSPVTYDRAWCYYGTDHGTLIRAVDAALHWDGGDDTAPEGWDKNAMTGEYASALLPAVDDKERDAPLGRPVQEPFHSRGPHENAAGSRCSDHRSHGGAAGGTEER